jgi:tetratricopeptide (TPR) repeat protein
MTALIGAGAMGHVYLADDCHLSRQVAIKVLAPGLLEDEDARRRFHQEAMSLSRLNHPGIATIHDFETVDGRDLLVMEYVAGTTLEARIGGRPLDTDAIADLGAQLAEGVAAAHACGIIHRDLKPANVRVTPSGRVKILDYGLAQLAPAAALEASTRTRAVGSPFDGTPAYMAPEQLRGKPADERSDVYALGAILYEMATGRRPVSAPHLYGLIDQALNTKPAPPRTINPSIPPRLEATICKALEKTPGLRYQHASELAVDLRRLALPDPSGRPIRRWHVAAAASVVAAIGIAAWLATREPAGPVIPFNARDWVLVADVPGDGAGTGEMVRESLTVALQQSRYVNVLPRDRVVAALKRMERPPTSVVDEATGVDLSRRENVKVLLLARVDHEGGGTRISVRGLDAAGQLLFVERAALHSERDMLGTLDVLAGRVRQHLGESLDQITLSRPLALVTTRSTGALQRYSRAVDQSALGQYSDAEASLKAALALDPDFAMAHFRLARVSQRLGRPAEERKHVETAHRLREKLTDRERLMIDAAYYHQRDEYQRAEDSLRTLAGLYPDDADGRHEFGLGLLYNGRTDEAADQFREALRLDPFNAEAYSKLALLLAETNKDREALGVADAALQRGLNTPELRLGRAMAIFGLDDTAAAARAFGAMAASAQESERVLGQLYAARLLIYEGKFAAAAASLEKTARADRAAGRTYPERVRRYLIGRLALLRGDRKTALEQAALMIEGDEVRVEHLHHAAELQVRAGDLTTAEGTRRRLEAVQAERPTPFTLSSLRLLEADLARGRRDLDRAVDLYHDADATNATYHAHVGLAEIAASRSDWPGAAKAWRDVIASRGEILRYGFPGDWVLAHVELARASAKAGVPVDARAAYARALNAWKDGDDTPYRSEARQAQARLSEGTTP